MYTRAGAKKAVMKILVLEMLKKWSFSRTPKITRGVPTAGTNVDCILSLLLSQLSEL